LLLAVDDAHWADEMSLRLVLYLARRVADLPVLLLVAVLGTGAALTDAAALAGLECLS
jgi:predicted ATPase